jgi:Undecaprenyl-phosphate glucose phosphotransferase
MRYDRVDISSAEPSGQEQPTFDRGALGVPPARKTSASAINWNLALDLWLAAELAALAAMMATSLHIGPGAVAGARNLVIVAAGWLILFAALSWHRRSVQSSRIRCDRLAPRMMDWVKASGLTLAGSFLVTDIGGIPRPWAGGMFVLGLALIGLFWLLARAAMARLAESGAIGDRVAIYGCNSDTAALIRAIETERGPAARIEALFDERQRGEADIDGRTINPSFNELLAQIKENRINTVVLDLPWSATTRISDLVQRLEAVSVDVLMAPAPIQLGQSKGSIGYIGSLPTLSLYRRPMIGLQAIGKAMMDRGLAALALILLSPFLLAVAIAIRLDSPGPILFRQKRRGMNNEPFDMLKFRSMYIESEDRNADRLVSRGDARVTKVGAFIRRTSIDELPQLLNVLLGDMSLVGPRPHAYGAKAADRLYEEVVGRYPARHRVPPGITGLAQVRGYRGNTGREEDIVNRVRSDLEYIDRWSLGLDILILARTAATFLFQRGAY